MPLLATSMQYYRKPKMAQNGLLGKIDYLSWCLMLLLQQFCKESLQFSNISGFEQAYFLEQACPRPDIYENCSLHLALHLHFVQALGKFLTKSSLATCFCQKWPAVAEGGGCTRDTSGYLSLELVQSPE